MKLSLEAKKREISTKSALKNLKKDGFVPAVVYAQGKIGHNILVSQKDFTKLVRMTAGGVAIVELVIDGKTIQSVVKDKQIHPVKRDYVHIDFQELLEGQPISLEIPINYIGEPEGVLEGGILDIMHRKLSIECLPKDIPEDIEINVSHLKMFDALHVSDVKLENVEIQMLPDTALAVVLEPKGLAETLTDEEEAEETEALEAAAEAEETEE